MSNKVITAKNVKITVGGNPILYVETADVKWFNSCSCPNWMDSNTPKERARVNLYNLLHKLMHESIYG
jgi:hypothetical protein